MEYQLIHSFVKNDTEEIRVSLREYKNRYYIDLRLFFRPSDLGEMIPSKKGLTFGIDLVPELKRGVIKFEEALRQLVASPKAAKVEEKVSISESD